MSGHLLFLAMAVGPVDAPKAEEVINAIGASQVAVMFVHDNKRTMFRATVIDRNGPTLTLLTAAHCLGPAEVGTRIRLAQGKNAAEGKVEVVIRNPSYRPAPSGDIPGADNAVARIKLDVIGDFPLETLKTAELVTWAEPDPDGGIATVQMIDQFEQPHKVRAGNYTNPRWLEWGPTYRPIPGDSGSGVFIVRTNRDGSLRLWLIGSVVDRSQSGGGASVLHMGDAWLRTALQRLDP